MPFRRLFLSRRLSGKKLTGTVRQLQDHDALRDVAFIGFQMPGNRVFQPFLLLVPLCLILVEKMALCKMLGAVLLCRLSVGDSSPPKDTGGGGQ